VEVVALGVEAGEVIRAACARERLIGPVALGQREVIAIVALTDSLLLAAATAKRSVA